MGDLHRDRQGDRHLVRRHLYRARDRVGNFNLNERNSNTTFTLTIRVFAPDGSSVVGHEVTHFALNANGVITVNFDKPSWTCS